MTPCASLSLIASRHETKKSRIFSFQINVAVQCLSTDFSSQKGVKVSGKRAIKFLSAQQSSNDRLQLVDQSSDSANH